MKYEDVELLGIRETLCHHAGPGQVGYMLFELLNSARYSPDEIREIATAMIEHAEHFQMLPDRR